jgi:hypothetical protein
MGLLSGASIEFWSDDWERRTDDNVETAIKQSLNENDTVSTDNPLTKHKCKKKKDKAIPVTGREGP